MSRFEIESLIPRVSEYISNHPKATVGEIIIHFMRSGISLNPMRWRLVIDCAVLSSEVVQ